MMINRIIYIQEILLFILLIKLIYGIEFKNRKNIVFVVLAGEILLSLPILSEIPIGFMFVIIVPGTYTMLEGNIFIRMKILISALMLFILSDQILFTVLKLLNMKIFEEIKSGILINDTLLILILLILLLLKKININMKKAIYIGNGKIITHILLIFLMTLLIVDVAMLQYMTEYIPSKKIYITVYVFSMMAFVGIVIIGYIIRCIYGLNANIIEKLEQEKLLKVTQEKYYEMLLQREGATKKFRHDIAGHLICIHELIKQDKTAQAIEYVGNLENSIADISEKIYKTGNDIIDILLNYHLNTVKNKEIEVNIVGYCEMCESISETDMCIIFDNLLKNAVEELKRKSGKVK